MCKSPTVTIKVKSRNIKKKMFEQEKDPSQYLFLRAILAN